MDPRLLAFEAARRQFVDGDATAAARDLAHAFGAVHPQTSTLRAIQAVIDQLDNPSAFARNEDAYTKHGATQCTFNRWKKKLMAFVVEEEVDIGTITVDDALDANLFAALETRAERLTKSQGQQDLQAVTLSPPCLTRAAPEPVISGDLLADAAAASGVSLAEALDKLTLSAADRHAAAIVAVDQAEAEAVLRERAAAEAAQDAAEAVQAAEAAKDRARQAAALADSARARVAAAHVAADAAAMDAAGEAAVRDEAREAEARQRAEAAASEAAGASSDDAPPPARADGASSAKAGQTLAAGQRVCIHGVQTRTELNSTYGRVTAFHAERGRYAVELEGSNGHVQTGRYLRTGYR